MFNALPKLGWVKSLLFLAVLSTSPVATGQSVQHNERCPTISVECPNSGDAGKPLLFRARLGIEDPNLRFEWEVHGNGTIVAGQGTPEITVEGNAERSITATLNVRGLDPSCPATASCSLIICRAPRAYLFDSYRWKPTEDVAKLKTARANKRRQVRTVKPK